MGLVTYLPLAVIAAAVIVPLARECVDFRRTWGLTWGAALATTLLVLPSLGVGLAAGAAVAARALLPGPLTLVLPNPARRFRWLSASRPDTIGIRVPELPEEARAVVQRVGVVAATSANAHGGRDPRRVDEIPDEIRTGCSAVVDVGDLPGVPSTVVDLTEAEPRVLRAGAVSPAEVLSRVAEATGQPRARS